MRGNLDELQCLRGTLPKLIDPAAVTFWYAFCNVVLSASNATFNEPQLIENGVSQPSTKLSQSGLHWPELCVRLATLFPRLHSLTTELADTPKRPYQRTQQCSPKEAVLLPQTFVFHSDVWPRTSAPTKGHQPAL